MTHPINTSFRPHSVTCWVDTQTVGPISGCSQEYDLPLGTVVRIVVIGVLANSASEVMAELDNAKQIAKVGRTQIAAMWDDNTQATVVSISKQAGASRAQVMRAALLVGAKRLANFSAQFIAERDARRAAHERSRTQLIKTMNRFQNEVVA